MNRIDPNAPCIGRAGAPARRTSARTAGPWARRTSARTAGPWARRTSARTAGPFRAGLPAIALALATASGCAYGPGPDEAYFSRLSGRESVESQLAGEALAQRKYSMRRIRRDLASFQRTLEQLQRHGKHAGIERFEGFARPFIELRVDPLVSDEASGSHPELRPFRAELLLSKALLMHQMHDPRAVRRTLARLEEDFAPMGSMLVLYPTGEAVTLEQGIALLRAQTGEI